MQTHEQFLNNQIKYILNHVDHRIAFRDDQPELVLMCRAHTKELIRDIPGCNKDRLKRLSLEKQVRALRALVLRHSL